MDIKRIIFSCNTFFIGRNYIILYPITQDYFIYEKTFVSVLYNFYAFLRPFRQIQNFVSECILKEYFLLLYLKFTNLKIEHATG